MKQSEKLKVQTERTDKELLELLLKELPGLIFPRKFLGICAVVSYLSRVKIIDFDEFERIEKIIDDNPTERFLFSYDIYYFPPGEVEPRIEYLKQLIEKYS